jgi:hypothetical protein
MKEPKRLKKQSSPEKYWGNIEKKSGGWKFLTPVDLFRSGRDVGENLIAVTTACPQN